MLGQSLLMGLIIYTSMLAISADASARWWNPWAPKDYQECAEAAAKSAASDKALRILLRNCASQFQGRRKTGGGYKIYLPEYDMNCSIDGPNPTPTEWKNCKSKAAKRFEEKKRKILEAKSRVFVDDQSIRCVDDWCINKSGSVSIVNGSDLTISRVSIGWVILPQSKAVECPDSYPSKKWFSVELETGASTTVNFIPFESTRGAFSYCIGIAEIDFNY